MFSRTVALVCVLSTACATTRLPPLPSAPRPTVIDTDAANFSVDETPYHVTLPPVPDVALQLGGNGEMVAPLNQNQPAPFPGVLFNGPATARLEVEFRAQSAQCQIDRQADLDRMGARAVTDIHLLQVRLHSQAESYGIMLRSRDTELSTLYTQLQEAHTTHPDYLGYTLLGAGGLVLGFGLGVVLGLFHP